MRFNLESRDYIVLKISVFVSHWAQQERTLWFGCPWASVFMKILAGHNHFIENRNFLYWKKSVFFFLSIGKWVIPNSRIVFRGILFFYTLTLLVFIFSKDKEILHPYLSTWGALGNEIYVNLILQIRGNCLFSWLVV